VVLVARCYGIRHSAAARITDTAVALQHSATTRFAGSSGIQLIRNAELEGKIERARRRAAYRRAAFCLKVLPEGGDQDATQKRLFDVPEDSTKLTREPLEGKWFRRAEGKAKEDTLPAVSNPRRSGTKVPCSPSEGRGFGVFYNLDTMSRISSEYDLKLSTLHICRGHAIVWWPRCCVDALMTV
jgi:hypothetical protein